MSSELSKRRIFIASPSGLEKERELIRDTIRDFNEGRAYEADLAFIPMGWERVPGTVGRPQGEINVELRKSDFMVLLLWDWWGSPTGADEAFTSGTQEEFQVATQCLADVTAPMRDILVLFKGVDERQLRDPGPQLAKVLDFKQALEQSKQILFQTVDTTDDIRRRLEQSLEKWVKPFAAKVARVVSVSSSSVSVMEPALGSLRALDVRQLAARAEELESAGLITQAEAAYVRAVSSNEPEYVLNYARFMRRTGRLERAFQINNGLLQSPQFIASDAPEIIAQRATVLTNMGIIRRKQGLLLDSRKCLDEAVRTARLGGPTGRESLAYALDNWGATLLRQGEVTRSRDAYEEALKWRRQGDDERGIAQSLINLARLGKQTGDLDLASKQAAEAIAMFEKIGDQRGIAEARELRGEALLALGSFAEARRELEIALDLNEKRGYSDGISVASGQLARVSLEMNDVPAAAAAARRSLAESVRSSNQEGIAIAKQILGLVERRQGDLVASVAFLTQALSSFANSGDVAREAASHLELAKTLVEQRKYGEAVNELRLAEKAADRARNSSVRASIERYRQGLGNLEAFGTLKT